MPPGGVRVMRRRGKPVPDLVDDNDEIAIRIEGAAPTDIDLLHDLRCARVPGRDQDRVVFPFIERAERRVGKLAAAERATVFQLEVA